MKKTLIALLALSGMAMAAGIETTTLAEYDFANSSLAPSAGTMKDSAETLSISGGWTANDGYVLCDKQGQYNGLYSGDSHAPIFKTTVEDWMVSITSTLKTGANARGFLQLGSSDYPGYTSAYGLYVGNGSGDRGVIGIQFGADTARFALTLTKANELKITIGDTENTYALAHYDDKLHFYINDVDVTTYLAEVSGKTGDATDFQKVFQGLNQTGVAVAKIGYANEIGNLQGADAGTQISSLIVSTVTTPPVPEPTTGTLSLLALAGLCARRRKH